MSELISDINSEDEFKNFHRLLCERFGYSHDEKDWKRDQLSLIEHIDSSLYENVLVVEKEPDYWSNGHFYEGTKAWVSQTKLMQIPIGTKLFVRKWDLAVKKGTE